jgi:glycosyltransferase involved in cell wall biosynthesis
MRICIVTIAGYVHGIGGMQRHTSDLARGLAGAGHDVVVITRRHPEGIRREVHGGALWRFVDSDGDQLGRQWLEASHAEFVAAQGECPFDVIHSESTCALGLVRKGVHREVPLVVKYHGNFLGLSKAYARRALRGRSPRAIAVEARGFVWLCGQHFRRGNWWRFHGFESMVPSRQQLADQRLSHLIPRSKLHVVPNGVDPVLFCPRDRVETRTSLGLGPEPTVLAVGRLNREKGMHTAVEALALLEPPARLVIVGAGEERARLGALVESLGVADRVIFAGAHAPETVALYLAAADVFVFPTERDEGAPLVLVEAMASGLPVVASRIPQIAEVVDREGENGFLVRPADPAGTTTVLRSLLTEPEHARRVGAAGRERVLAEYTIARMIVGCVEVYEKAIRDHPRRARVASDHR